MYPKDPLTKFFENPDVFGMGGACVIVYILVFMALMILVFGPKVFDDSYIMGPVLLIVIGFFILGSITEIVFISFIPLIGLSLVALSILFKMFS